MTIKELIKTLREKFPSHELLQNKEYNYTEEDGSESSYKVDAVLQNDKFILAIKEAKNQEEINIIHYNYGHFNIRPYYSIILINDKIYCREMNYVFLLSKRKNHLFDFEDSPMLSFKHYEKITIETLISMIQDFPLKVKAYTDIDIAHLLEELASLCNKNYNDFAEKIKAENIEYNNEEFWFNRDSEVLLMSLLLNENEFPPNLYRYTSIRSLFRMFPLGDNMKSTHNMSSLIAMNDVTEIDYANAYLLKKGVNDIEKVIKRDREDSPHTFITSFSDKEDDLTMWRLYGDNAKGVCIVYDAKTEIDTDHFMLAKVNYAEQTGKNPKLDAIAKLMKFSSRNRIFRLKLWHIWQHFFKPYEYNVESEVRLLVFTYGINLSCYNKEWITTNSGILAPILLLPLESSKEKISYPFRIKKILLGRKYIEKESNKSTLQLFINEKYSKSLAEKFCVEVSKIDCFR